MKVNSNILFKNVILCFIFLYFAQGVIYENGSFIAKISLLIILSISAIYLLKTLLRADKKPLFYWAWLFLLSINIFGFISGGNYSGTHYSQIKNICIAILPFFAFYYFSLKDNLQGRDLLIFSILITPIIIANFYISKIDFIDEFMVDEERVVSNIAYLFIILIPYVFLWGEKKILAIINMLLIIFFVFQGAKRGAFILGMLGVLVFVYYQITSLNPKKRKIGFVVSLVGLTFLTLLIYQFYQSNEYLVERLQSIDSNTSGRDIIYRNLWNNWYTSDNVINVLFGFGFVSTIYYSGYGLLAHNDWLELLTNFGLIGVSSYLAVFCSIVYFLLYEKMSKEDKTILITILLIASFQTIFSMYYTSSGTIFNAILLGYVFGKKNRKIHNHKI